MEVRDLYYYCERKFSQNEIYDLDFLFTGTSRPTKCKFIEIVKGDLFKFQSISASWTVTLSPTQLYFGLKKENFRGERKKS